MTSTTGNIITKTFGQNNFTFEVVDFLGSKGLKKQVKVTQETVWSKEDIEIFGMEMENNITKWNLFFDITTSEFGAINLAGKKLIKNWENI